MGRYLTLSSCVLAALLLTGCDMDGRDNRVTQDFHYSYELQPGGHLDLTNTNGSVEVTGWDRNSIEVSGTKYASDQGALDHVQVKVDAHGDSARISTELPKGDWWHGGGYGVHYRIHVPRRIKLDRLETTNGQISAENLEGGGRVSSTNGKLSLTHLTGDYRATTTNGGIEWEECSGDETAETTNGAVRAHHKAGSMQAESTNGSIDLTLEQPTERKPIRVSTTNGSVTLAVAQYRGNPIKAETTHGTVNLRLPSDTNARLSVETSMASISNELPLSTTEEHSKHELRGQLGSGGPEISATSSMGSIRIQRY
jgi:hypothetical protein